MTCPLSHADVLRAIRGVKATTDRARRDVARLLGFEWKAAVPGAARESPQRREKTPRTGKRRRSRSLPGIAPEATVETAPQPVSFSLSGPEPAQAAPPVLPATFPDFSQRDVLLLEPAPLFVPRWTRAILSTALSTLTDAGSIDLVETVRLVASGRPLRRLPQRRIGRMAPAAQVLVDAGEAMTPFLADQVRLTADLAQVIGASALEVLKFVGTPLRNAGRGPRRTWAPYAPPPPGTAIVLITDFGIADVGFAPSAVSVGEWLEFFALMQVRGCPAIALVPYGAQRWPPEIARAVPIVRWDRATTVREVRFRTASA